MAKISKKDRREISSLTKETLDTLLKLHVSCRAINFAHERLFNEWRNFVELLHQNYPIKGTGIVATKTNLRVNDAEDGGFIHMDVDLLPDEIIAEMQSFPQDAASAAYVFTLLEDFGDRLVDIVNPGILQARQAWHAAVNADLNLKKVGDRKKARSRLAKIFAKNEKLISRDFLVRLQRIKILRNEFMHEGNPDINFDKFLYDALAIASFLYFLILPMGNCLSRYPFSDYHNVFAND
jgi:hypothetical protein